MARDGTAGEREAGAFVFSAPLNANAVFLELSALLTKANPAAVPKLPAHVHKAMQDPRGSQAGLSDLLAKTKAKYGPGGAVGGGGPQAAPFAASPFAASPAAAPAPAPAPALKAPTASSAPPSAPSTPIALIASTGSGGGIGGSGERRFRVVIAGDPGVGKATLHAHLVRRFGSIGTAAPAAEEGGGASVFTPLRIESSAGAVVVEVRVQLQQPAFHALGFIGSSCGCCLAVGGAEERAVGHQAVGELRWGWRGRRRASLRRD